MPVADFTSNAATLNTYLNKVGGTIISGWYITSTEATSEGENYCTCLLYTSGTGTVDGQPVTTHTVSRWGGSAEWEEGTDESVDGEVW